MNNQERLIIDKEQLNDLVNSCQEEIRRLKDRIDFYEDIESDRLSYIDELKEENQRLNNVLNELKEWFKEFHKYHSRLRWNEVDYIEFIEHLENELKESDK